MKPTRPRTATAGVAAGIIGAAALLSACGASTSHSSTRSAPAGSADGAPAAHAPLTIGTARGPIATHLTGPGGRALYLWLADSPNRSRCTGACARVWPPLIATTTPKAGGGVQASGLATIARPGGGTSRQVTYRGHPLYSFAADRRPGATAGQGVDSFGAKWWLVGPAGSALTSTGATSSSTASGASGYSGY